MISLDHKQLEEYKVIRYQFLRLHKSLHYLSFWFLFLPLFSLYMSHYVLSHGIIAYARKRLSLVICADATNLGVDATSSKRFCTIDGSMAGS